MTSRTLDRTTSAIVLWAIDAYEVWYSGPQNSIELWSKATGRAIIPAAAWALVAVVVLIADTVVVQISNSPSTG